jgi:hypothetical protein
LGGRAPADAAFLHAALLLLRVDGRGVLEADDLVEELAAVGTALVVERPALAIVDAGLPKAPPVRIIGDDRATSAAGLSDSTTGSGRARASGREGAVALAAAEAER